MILLLHGMVALTMVQSAAHHDNAGPDGTPWAKIKHTGILILWLSLIYPDHNLHLLTAHADIPAALA